LFDTHCHLNFKEFNSNVSEVINRAQDIGVEMVVVPGTDLNNSQKAIEIAKNNKGIFAAVGIHPHHVKEYLDNFVNWKITIEKLLNDQNVVAVGEVGLDKHEYSSSRYQDNKVTMGYLNLQKQFLVSQLKLAVSHNKSLILHNRKATGEILDVLEDNWSSELVHRTVFHCCEPEEELLDFAISHNIFIGIDGDITYKKRKQEFIKRIPLNLLVLETDSPLLLPEPLKSIKEYPNEPKNLLIIADFISNLLKIRKEELIKQTTRNAKILFGM